MDYSLFKQVLNEKIFDNSKSDLLTKIANSPDRYIGLFRPTKPRAKILQNLLQSNEIRFGDAMETLFEHYFTELGFTNLPKKIGDDKTYLSCDQLFKKSKTVYFIEQKVRDDHDSTKKRGQIAQDYGVTAQVVYGQELWDSLDCSSIWEELLTYLKRWKNEIPDMPSINFDDLAAKSFTEIKDLEPSVYRKLLNNEEICAEILPILFPQKKVLKLLQRHFVEKGTSSSIYKTLADKLKNIIGET